MTHQAAVSFQQAAKFKLPFGPFEGKTLDQTAETDNGLRYLDNLRGKLEQPGKRLWGKGLALHVALCAYLDDAAIASDLENLIEKQTSWRSY